MENISLFVLSRCAELGKKVRLQFSRAEYFSSVYWVILIFSRAEYFSSVWWWLIHTRLNNFRSIFHPFANDCYTWLNNLRSIFHPFADDWYTNLAEQSQEWLKSAIGKICTISPSCSLILRASQHFGTFFATNHSGQGCISCGTCSYPELTEDHVLTSAYENQSAPKLENRKTSPCSPCAPNLLHVLVSRIPGYHNLCSPGQGLALGFL